MAEVIWGPILVLFSTLYFFVNLGNENYPEPTLDIHFSLNVGSLSSLVQNLFYFFIGYQVLTLALNKPTADNQTVQALFALTELFQHPYHQMDHQRN